MKEQRKCIVEQIFGGNRELSEASCFHSTCPPARSLPCKRRVEKEKIINGPTAQTVLERPFADVLICPWKFALACCEGNFIPECCFTFYRELH